ncbi:formylmethanofuran dehydrogenase subunit C, partial [Candidatus Bathyarchaeota archaeon]|nr:formylmethanofuran dehydrogenase subunit C [Candidatus Bathyarchaeota archaeon]
MHGGTILVEGNCEARAGACMTEGKIVITGFLESVLPTFTIEGLRNKVKIEETDSIEGPFYMFSGDLAERGNGKLYVSKRKNPHLSVFEKLL